MDSALCIWLVFSVNGHVVKNANIISRDGNTTKIQSFWYLYCGVWQDHPKRWRINLGFMCEPTVWVEIQRYSMVFTGIRHEEQKIHKWRNVPMQLDGVPILNPVAMLLDAENSKSSLRSSRWMLPEASAGPSSVLQWHLAPLFGGSPTVAMWRFDAHFAMSRLLGCPHATWEMRLWLHPKNHWLSSFLIWSTWETNFVVALVYKVWVKAFQQVIISPVSPCLCTSAIKCIC